VTASPDAAPLLAVDAVSKTFRRRGRTRVTAVDGVSFALQPAETLALVGESGCGKTTLGRLVLDLVRPDAGEIRLRGRVLAAMDRRERRHYRRAVQMVFQNPLAAFNPMLTIGASLRDAMHLMDELDRDAREARAEGLLRRVRLDPSYLGRRPAEMSGGQLQRVGVARALATDPEVIFLDEPTSALDMSIRGQILELLAELQAETGMALVLVSHDMRVVRAVASRVAVMYLGHVVEEGSVEGVTGAPRHPYTRALLGAAFGTRRAARISGEARGAAVEQGCRLRGRCPFELHACSAPQELAPIEPGHLVRCWRAGDIVDEPMPAASEGPGRAA
jgi:oligopeptide/dipeptide ABC transporter ATP-binding protein